jgi:hypothetical protein
MEMEHLRIGMHKAKQVTVVVPPLPTVVLRIMGTCRVYGVERDDQNVVRRRPSIEQSGSSPMHLGRKMRNGG